MPKPKEYVHIKAWGEMMGSYPYYIRDQQEMASEDNAPLDAIYKCENWITYKEVENPETRLVVGQILKKYAKNNPS